MELILPVLGIDSYEEAVDFYVRGLGFSIAFEHRHEPDFPVYMVIEKGDLRIGLSEHSRGHPGTELYVIVHDIASWYQLCINHDIDREHDPQQMPWGHTEMLVKDPSRNALRFTQEQTHEATTDSS